MAEGLEGVVGLSGECGWREGQGGRSACRGCGKPACGGCGRSACRGCGRSDCGGCGCLWKKFFMDLKMR